MFYKMIEAKRDKWINLPGCPVKDLLHYMLDTGKLRDAQIEAVKTYLFLKIACINKPLYQLFAEGKFNITDAEKLENLPLSTSTRKYLQKHPEAVALYDFVSLEQDDNEIISKKTKELIEKNPEAISDYRDIFKKFFYDVEYSDYIFSLPMGAGKTYLMAIFIYLDLYYAKLEPNNKAFAHNFIIFAPSGLKSSVVPSLKTIENFDPSWIIPEPAATEIKRLLKFEVLDAVKSEKKSNKTKNPNVQKIAINQPLSELFGFIAVCNAEKVILDKVKIDNKTKTLIELFDETDDGKDRQANELRNLIGKIPDLAIYIDEVHHASAATSDIKLRAVINNWTTKGQINGVLGFSGTPYLDKSEKTTIAEKINLNTVEITNIVYYYRLVDGIGNFLKKPVVKVEDGISSENIVENGTREFLDNYGDKIYKNGCCAKLAIYCSQIEKLEEVYYPLIEKIVEDYKLSPEECILRFHKGNNKYSEPKDAQMKFDSLDKDISKIKIILLVQIGKEGWDCQSLTGVILPQEGSCPTNMVLQTSCRCLRQVVPGEDENALIYLNKFNGTKLDVQLKKQHHMSVNDFQTGGSVKVVKINRYSRMKKLKVPPLEFKQMYLRTDIIEEKDSDVLEYLKSVCDNAKNDAITVQTGKFSNDGIDMTDTTFLSGTNSVLDYTSYNQWIYSIAKESFGNIAVLALEKYHAELKRIFDTITEQQDSITVFSKKYKQDLVRANIRKAFYPQRDFKTKEELLPEKASILSVDVLPSPITVEQEQEKHYVPNQNEVEKIIADDNGKNKIDLTTLSLIKLLRDSGENEAADEIEQKHAVNSMIDHTYHYLPYRTDSSLEIDYFNELLKLNALKEKKLEVYYNGDDNLTDFKIRCYSVNNNRKNYIGHYIPDFLIIHRKKDKIDKALIVETKGSLYANEPKFKLKKEYIEKYFVPQNFDKFRYLYLEDKKGIKDLLSETNTFIYAFFKED